MTFLFNQIDVNNKDVIVTSGAPLCTRVPDCKYINFEGNGTSSMYIDNAALSKGDQVMLAGSVYYIEGGGDTGYGTNVTKAEADAFDGYYYLDGTTYKICTNKHKNQ